MYPLTMPPRRKPIAGQGTLSLGAGGMQVVAAQAADGGSGDEGEGRAGKRAKLDLKGWVDKHALAFTWLEYDGERGRGHAQCTICVRHGVPGPFSGLGGHARYTDADLQGGQAAKLTTTFLKRHAEKHGKLPSQQLAEAAPLNAGRAESWVRRGVLKNIAAIKNIAITTFGGLAAGLTFRQLESLIQDVLPLLQGTVDTSSLSGAEGDAVRCATTAQCDALCFSGWCLVTAL